MATKRKRLAPKNQPSLPTFHLNRQQVKFVEELSKYPPDERQRADVMLECFSRVEDMAVSYHMTGAYRKKKEIWDLLELIDQGKPYKVEIIQRGTSRPDSGKQAQIEKFWEEMEKDIGMNVVRCAKKAGISSQIAYAITSVSEGQERKQAILQARRESHKGMEINLVEGASAIAFLDPSEVFEVDKDGRFVKLKPLSQIPHRARHAIKEVKLKDGFLDSVKFESKNQAASLLMRVYGLLDRDNSIVDPEELASELRKFVEDISDSLPDGVI